MLLSICFSSVSLCLIIGVSFALMILLTLYYGRDRRHRRLFVTAWVLYFAIHAVGLSCIRSESQHARERISRLLNKMADHLAISLREVHAAIPPEPSEDDPRYQEALSLLAAWQADMSEVASLFTLRKKPNGAYHFILAPALDTNRDGIICGALEETDPPGTVYFIDDETVLRDIEAAFQGENVISRVSYRDLWGVWLTAYRPLRTSDEKIDAIFGIDYWGDDWNRTILQARIWPSLFFYSFLSFFFLQLLHLVKQRNEEKNLRHYFRELEKMIATTKEIQHHLTVTNQNKRVFLENMCDELKNAVEPCFASIDELEILFLSENTERFREPEILFEKICGECIDVLTLLDSIDTYLQASMTKVALSQEPFPIRHFFKMLENEVSARLKVKPEVSFEISIDENVPDTISVDHHRLRMILLELLNSAVHRSEYGTIRVDVSIGDSIAEKMNSDVEERERRPSSSLSGELFLHDDEPLLFEQISYMKITIGDEANRISDRRIGMLFRPFSERRPRSDRSGAIKFGLGMARCQARIAGGKLRRVDHGGPGNTFQLLIPAVLPPSDGFEHDHHPASIPIDSRPLEGYRVLIVDAHIATQIFVETFLNNAGAQTVTTGTGNEAIGLLLHERKEGRFFDLMIMDVHLPHVNGSEMSRKIRNHGFMRPIIIMGTSLDRIDFPVSEFDAILAKPIDKQLLLQTILRLTDAKRRVVDWNLLTTR